MAGDVGNLEGMARWCREWVRWVRCALSEGEAGQGLTEYASIAVLASIVAVFLIVTIASRLPSLFQGALNAL